MPKCPLFLLLVAGLLLAATHPARAQVNMTPTIADLPSPIVANGDTSHTGKFVFPDALDVDQMATDDITPQTELIWSYTIPGTPRYLINGVTPINPAVISPLNPPSASRIDMTVAGGELNPDGRANTITVRNKALSPLGGATTTPTATGVLPSETQKVVFFCSDGNSYSSSSTFFYTDNGGSDRLSSGWGRWPWPDKIPKPWIKNPSEWAPAGLPDNHITTSTWPIVGGTSGICLNGTLEGNNYGSVISSYPYFNIAMNQVYRIRMKMITSQATPGNVPLWDIILENYESHSGKGLNLYAMDTIVFANEGAANAISSSGSTFTFYWTPPAVAAPQWNNTTNGAFTPAMDNWNDPRLRFRMMDCDLAAGSQSNLKSGAVCIREIEVASAPITRAQAVGAPLVNITTLADHGTTGGNVECVPALAGLSSAVFAGGTLTIAPLDPPGSADGRNLNLTDVRPATDATFSMDPANPASRDNFPIAWKTGKILRLQVGLSAPTAYEEAHPWDAVGLAFHTMTNELVSESYQMANLGIGSPKMGTPQTYTMFFDTGYETKSPVAGYHRLRWLVRFINSPVTLFPNGQTLNIGAVRVHSIKVDEVVFK